MKKWRIIAFAVLCVMLMQTGVIARETEDGDDDVLVNLYMKNSALLNIQVSDKKKLENFEHNKSLEYKPTDILDTQKGNVGEYLLGTEQVKNVGCGAVALYNALIFKGKRRNFEDVLYKCEKITMLRGKFGCNSYKLGNILSCFGLVPNEDFKYAHKYEDIDSIKDYGKVFVAAFWNKDTIFGGAHIIALKVKDDGTIRAYNSSKPNYPSFDAFKNDKLTEKKFIALYAIR